DLADVEGRLVQVLDQLVRLGGRDQGQVDGAPGVHHRPVVVPAAQHAEELVAEAGVEDAVHFVHRQHERAAGPRQDVLFQVARAAADVAAAPRPEVGYAVVQAQGVG